MATNEIPRDAARPPAPVPPGPVGTAVRGVGAWVEFLWEALRGVVTSGPHVSESMRQAAQMLRGTLLFLVAMNLFMGMTTATFGFFFLRSLGASDYLGLLSGYVIPRENATTMFGYIFVSKVCCGFAAELGAMRTQQEIDGLEAAGVDPMRYVVGTRMVAVLLFTPIAALLGLLVQFGGSFLDGVVILQGISPQVLVDVHWSVQTLQDQLYALVTMMVIAVTTAATACFFGLRARGGPVEVGTATARSVLVNLILLHVIAVTFALLFYGSDVSLPIAS